MGERGHVSGSWSVNESWPEPPWLIFVSSPFEIKEILHLATLNNLEVIPLVQTFGHMEVSQRNRSHLMPGVGLRCTGSGQPQAGSSSGPRGEALAPRSPCPVKA